jgi:hypothetical protein
MITGFYYDEVFGYLFEVRFGHDGIEECYILENPFGRKIIDRCNYWYYKRCCTYLGVL